jgi:hypothetical protein
MLRITLEAMDHPVQMLLRSVVQPCQCDQHHPLGLFHLPRFQIRKAVTWTQNKRVEDKQLLETLCTAQDTQPQATDHNTNMNRIIFSGFYVDRASIFKHLSASVIYSSLSTCVLLLSIRVCQILLESGSHFQDKGDTLNHAHALLASKASSGVVLGVIA